MASIADLNVRLGFLYSDFEKGIKAAQRITKRAAADLDSAGNQLTKAFALPLLGIGAAAVKAAGDMEALRLAMRATFEGAGRSMAAADAELEKLRESAKAPGLDFEQAVRGSVRLQNVGFTAEKSRRIIEQLANTIATTGGTAEDLNEVVNQFSQMIGKGKIFQDDLKIITGRMPKVAQLLKETFGTTTAEGLNALGIDARTLVDTLTEKMANLPRVTGGIANAIVNAGNAVRQFLASMGDSLDKTFNITGKLDGFSSFLEGVAKGFSEMDESTRRLATGVAVFAVALGPALKAGSLLVQVYGGVTAAIARMTTVFQAWLLVSSNPEAKTGLISWFGKLDKATKLTTIGALVGVAIAAAAAFALLSKNMSATAQAARTVEDVSKSAAESIVDEKLKATSLISTLNNLNSTEAERAAALNELKKISPQYFGQLDTEKDKIDRNEIALSAYTDAIFRAAKAQAAYDKIVELEKSRFNLIEQSDPSLLQNFVNFLKSGGNATRFFSENAQTLGKNFKENNEVINAQVKALTQLYEANKPLQNNNTAPKPPGGNNLDDLKKQADTYKEVLSDIANVSAQQDLLGAKNILDQADTIEAGIKKLLDAGFKPMSAEVQNLKAQLQGLFTGIKGPELPEVQALPTLPAQEVVTSITGGDQFKSLAASIAIATAKMVEFKSVTQQLGEINLDFQGGLLSFNEAFTQTAELVAANGTLMQQAIMGASAAMSEAATSGASSFGELAGAAAQAAAKVVRAWIQQGVAAAVAKALGGLPFPFNIAAGAAAGGLAAAAFNKALGAIKVPGFEQGTDSAPGGPALVGEGGRELVLPPGTSEMPSPVVRSLDLKKGAAVVGTGGPELVDLPRGAQVIPNPEFKSMLSEIKIPGFVQGTPSAPGGAALVGEKGAELVLPAEKTKQEPQPEFKGLLSGVKLPGFVQGTPAGEGGAELVLPADKKKQEPQPEFKGLLSGVKLPGFVQGTPATPGGKELVLPADKKQEQPEFKGLLSGVKLPGFVQGTPAGKGGAELVLPADKKQEQPEFKGLLKGLKIPGFAYGTKDAPGGLALVGEKGPELVSLPKHSQVTPNNQLSGMMGGGSNFIVSHRVQGSDLLFIIEREQRNIKRTRGF